MSFAVLSACLLSGCCSLAGRSETSAWEWRKVPGGNPAMSLKKAQEACRTQARAECVANDDHPDICTDLTGPRYFDTCMRERGYELHSRRVRACQGMKFF